jgi:hypothetical protein
MAAAGTSRTGAGHGRSGAPANRGRLILARVIGAIAAIVALILLLGIVLVLLKANPANAVVEIVRDAASWLAGPLEGMFDLKRKRTEVAVNWGVAAVVWFVLGRLLARLIAP